MGGRPWRFWACAVAFLLQRGPTRPWCVGLLLQSGPLCVVASCAEPCCLLITPHESFRVFGFSFCFCTFIKYTHTKWPMRGGPWRFPPPPSCVEQSQPFLFNGWP